MSVSEALQLTLVRARRVRRISQLELSLRLGVSQRHISFVECGRSRPSRALLLAWMRALDAPLAVQNAALQQAGFAPAYSAVQLGDPALQQAHAALSQLLAAHDPMPALVLDEQWNVVELNRGAHWLARTLAPERVANADGALNMLDLLIHPRGFAPCMVNLEEVAQTLLLMLRLESVGHPLLGARLPAFQAALEAHLGHPLQVQDWVPPNAPVLTTRLRSPWGELAFFSLFTTFGTPQDITLASLRVEHLCAADAQTRAVLHAHVD